MRAAAALGAFLGSTMLASADCAPDAVDLRGDWGSVRFAVELADEEAEHARGLMHREELGRFDGMLFVYPRPGRATFWMKNTLIPLDMIFIDRTGRVTRIHENATPLSLETIDGGPGVKAVLEINGGTARKLGIGVGSELRHPRFDQETAAWACE